ncbi:MAG: hypothetical protein KGQ49_06540, partial [Verrucomicrobia bacterium]|nr:hypothetical protein [Verrucomicrobiota bacterium]
MRTMVFLLLHIALLATDFDCILVGSSPFSLFEALYQNRLGHRVLVLEEAGECGGAWKGIDVCGVQHADLGCHQIGRDLHLKAFLEKYTGCKIVPMDYPDQPFDSAALGPNGWYFSRGCYELIENLLALIAKTDIVILNHTRAELITIDAAQQIATVKTNAQSYTAKKVIVTPMSSVPLQSMHSGPHESKSKYLHLYMLIQDPTPPRFSYYGGAVRGCSRMMNLTPFVDLAGTGRQLIVLQVHSENDLWNGQALLNGLKQNKLVDEGAYILESEPYIYETGNF